MLILTRRVGETLMIGDNVTVATSTSQSNTGGGSTSGASSSGEGGGSGGDDRGGDDDGEPPIPPVLSLTLVVIAEAPAENEHSFASMLLEEMLKLPFAVAAGVLSGIFAAYLLL